MLSTKAVGLNSIAVEASRARRNTIKFFVKYVYKHLLLLCPEQWSHQKVMSFAPPAMSIIAFVKADVTSETDLPKPQNRHDLLLVFLFTLLS